MKSGICHGKLNLKQNTSSRGAYIITTFGVQVLVVVGPNVQVRSVCANFTLCISVQKWPAAVFLNLLWSDSSEIQSPRAARSRAEIYQQRAGGVRREGDYRLVCCTRNNDRTGGALMVPSGDFSDS